MSKSVSITRSSVLAAAHDEHADQEAKPKRDTDGLVRMLFDNFVRRPSRGSSPFFQAFAGVFGSVNRSVEFCDELALFVFFSFQCVHICPLPFCSIAPAVPTLLRLITFV